MKTKHMKWIILIAIIAVIFFVAYLVRNTAWARTNLQINIDNIERIDLVSEKSDGTSTIKMLEISPWVDFFNSLELTYHKCHI